MERVEQDDDKNYYKFGECGTIALDSKPLDANGIAHLEICSFSVFFRQVSI